MLMRLTTIKSVECPVYFCRLYFCNLEVVLLHLDGGRPGVQAGHRTSTIAFMHDSAAHASLGEVVSARVAGPERMLNAGPVRRLAAVTRDVHEPDARPRHAPQELLHECQVAHAHSVPAGSPAHEVVGRPARPPHGAALDRVQRVGVDRRRRHG